MGGPEQSGWCQHDSCLFILIKIHYFSNMAAVAMDPASAASQIGLPDKRIIEKIAAGPFQDDPAFLQHVCPVGHLQGRPDILLDKQHRNAALGNFTDKPERSEEHTSELQSLMRT